MEAPNYIQETQKLFLILLCFLACSTIAKAEVSEEDKAVLLELYRSTNGPEWIKKWDIEQSPSNWHGVKIVQNKIIAITLFHNNLSFFGSSFESFPQLSATFFGRTGLGTAAGGSS